VEEAGVPGEPPAMGKQLVIFITCDCESSASFFVIYKTKINQSNQYDVPFVKSALNFTVLAQKLLLVN
jgi:hypothetical protein